MAKVINRNARELIQRFTPLCHIDRKYHGKLASELKLISVEPGESIVRKARNPKLMHFLVKGKVAIRRSFEERHTLSQSHTLCHKALEADLPGHGTVKATEKCILLVANADHLDQYLSWSQDYTIFYLDDHDYSATDSDLIDDNYQEDWDNQFIRSKLAANLPNRAIHQLLSQLEDVEVEAGEAIVRANTPGDYFYIIKQGVAEVSTPQHGPFAGQRFHLVPGNYFGDEALVAETLRNASVTMNSRGLLGRLSADAFNHLVKQHLVSTLKENIEPGADRVNIIDVRLPIEYKQGHSPHSTNLPISHLRQRMTQLKDTHMYVMSPANDRRAELATYLLRQAGFEAYCMAQ